MSQVVFIIGICPRSGTNFLYNLLAMHQDCQVSSRGGQDNLLYAADYLEEYCNKVSSYWKAHWGQSKQDLLMHLGNGLQKYLVPASTTKIIITKTPHTYNLDSFFDIFPDSKLIVVIRDGPDAIESGVRSFNWTYEDSYRMWNASAQRIIDFKHRNSQNKNFLLVRFEDLVRKGQTTMKQVFAFCDLDVQRYDFDVIDNAPVVGSSSLKASMKFSAVHWKPVPKEKGFSPIGRASSWSTLKHYRYNFVCGKNAQALGYQLLYPNTGFPYRLYNAYKTFSYFIFRVVRRVKIALRFE